MVYDVTSPVPPDFCSKWRLWPVHNQIRPAGQQNVQMLEADGSLPDRDAQCVRDDLSALLPVAHQEHIRHWKAFIATQGSCNPVGWSNYINSRRLNRSHPLIGEHSSSPVVCRFAKFFSLGCSQFGLARLSTAWLGCDRLSFVEPRMRVGWYMENAEVLFLSISHTCILE